MILLGETLDLPVPGEWIVQGGAVALLILVALLVFTGRLVPLRTVKDLQQDRDYWRKAALQAMGQTEQLIPAADITTQVVRAMSDRTDAPPATGR